MKECKSELFIKTTKLTIAPVGGITPTEKSIKRFFADVIQREKEEGNPEVSFDGDLWNWFPKKESGFTTAFETVVYRFKQTIAHKTILAEAERLGIKKVYSYTEGLAIIRAVVLAGEIDGIGKGVFVYCMSPQKDSLCRFRAFRYADGELCLVVPRVDLDIEWYAGHGTCFSNNEPQED